MTCCKSPPTIGSAAARLRRVPHSDRLTSMGVFVCALLILLGGAGFVLIVHTVYTSLLWEFNYVHFYVNVVPAALMLLLAIGAVVRLTLHRRCARPVDDQVPALRERQAYARPEPERLKAMRVQASARLKRIGSPGEMTPAERIACWLMIALGLYGLWYPLQFGLGLVKDINERALVAAPLTVLLGVLSALRLWSYSRAQSAGGQGDTPVKSEVPSDEAVSTGESQL